MLFNSFTFIIFFLIVFSGYWFVFSGHLKRQNAFLLFSSYVFYGWWDWRFLLLKILSSLFGFFAGYLISTTDHPGRRKLLLALSITANLGFLGVFKYYNFFASSFVDLLHTLGMNADEFTLKIVLPIGISFYTFHNISYVIDVYRKELNPTRDIIAYFSFISFFPQLVAGPIMKAKDFLPQFLVKRNFEYSRSIEGLRFMLWGYFKKIVIADGCGVMVDAIFENYSSQPSSILMLGVFYFAIQIYGDFSGYTDIAIGLGKLFGFEFTLNFKTPYFSRTIPEFWKRWHISLTSWFRDYVYISIGGNRGNHFFVFRNIMIVFLLSGLWHGANYTFIVWGMIHGLLYLPSIFLSNKKRSPYIAYQRAFPSVREIIQMCSTFTIVCIAWVFFRSPSLSAAFGYFKALMINPFMPSSYYFFSPFNLLPLLFFFFIMEWVNRDKDCQLHFSFQRPIRWILYTVILMNILFHVNFHKASEFIYFQF